MIIKKHKYQINQNNMKCSNIVVEKKQRIMNKIMNNNNMLKRNNMKIRNRALKIMIIRQRKMWEINRKIK